MRSVPVAALVVALLPAALPAQDEATLRYDLRFAEAAFTSTFRYEVTQRAQGANAVGSLRIENDLAVTWRARTTDAGVALEVRQEGTLSVSQGTRVARYKLGDPPGDEVRTLEPITGPPRKGWDYRLERTTGALALIAAYDGRGNKCEATPLDERGRAQFEASLRAYRGRPARVGSTWTCEDEVMLSPGVKPKRTVSFVTTGERRWKSIPCVVVEVKGELAAPPAAGGQAGTTRLLEQSYTREDLFAAAHGLLARSTLDTRLVLERDVKGQKQREERRTEFRWTLESVR